MLKGTASLSDAELLNILIGSGTPQENSLDIAQKIMASCQNNLREFWKLGISDLQKLKGIGKQRACQIASMFALSRRRNAAEVVVKPKISRSQDAYTVFHSLIGELPYEEFWMLLLNRANKIMKTVKVSEGGISGTVVDPKKIFFIALENHASSLILVPVEQGDIKICQTGSISHCSLNSVDTFCRFERKLCFLLKKRVKGLSLFLGLTVFYP